MIPEETLKQLKEKSATGKINLNENPEELFKQLAEPKTAKIKASKEDAAPEGYDKTETQSLDLLIENTAE